MGHCRNYVPVDVACRHKAMQGCNVLQPMGWDAFGQPAENEAIKKGRNPREMVPEYAANYKRQLKLVGISYDWSREINSSLPDYCRWTQWFFLLLYRRGLAYRATTPINWCPPCKTGLANEEVVNGRCWRCGSPMEKRPMPQWYFRITAYADRLIAGLDTIQWPEGIKTMQREWIGRSEGAEVDFDVARRTAGGPCLRVFTTRPDTLWGATFMVIAPEHPLVMEITTDEHRAEVEEYRERAQRVSEIDRLSVERTKTGVFTGAHAINPVDGNAIPIYVADYVLMGYGTGAIMAVPAHDQRDFEFAKKNGILITLVYRTAPDQTASSLTEAVPSGGEMVQFTPSPGAKVGVHFPFAGLPNNGETVGKVIRWLEGMGVGKGVVNYRLRDWLISRQRYWGAPIPIIHCEKCGEVPVPEGQLPVVLPEVEQYQPTWVIDGNDAVSKAKAAILYSTAVPIVWNVVITDNGDGTATVTWDTDVAAEGAAHYGPVAIGGATPNVAAENDVGFAHTAVMTGIVAGTNYKIVLVNNEAESDPYYWPLKWPLSGDANMDCRVNILDRAARQTHLRFPSAE